MRYLIFLFFFLISPRFCEAQLLKSNQRFTKADTLRGMLTPLRTCYDINYYHLDIKVDLEKKQINGSNLFCFTAVADFKDLQFDLFDTYRIERIDYRGQNLQFRREFNAVFISFPEILIKGSKHDFKVFYSGAPIIAKAAPWDGGFVFSKDSSGKPWVGVACQGLGASSWWPTKDHQSDEPDSMLISVSVPKGLMNISNGTLRSTTEKENNYTQYNWFISNPINNYNVTLNIGDYAHFSDSFDGESGKLNLNYYVLKDNLAKAKPHFDADVKPMLKAFEHWFGPYPFYRDGYKLVETPYLGMEHQSAIAYGNDYKKGYRGKDLSGTGLGLFWDFIIVHESGHEWFGNNITSKDIADMWIHESFTNYSEGLFVESIKGKSAGAEYIKGLRKGILNDIPIIGPSNVNKEGSGDMYMKGSNMLHTVRSIIDDDDKWRHILRGLNQDFWHKTTTTDEIAGYINQASGKNLRPVFDQYLRYTAIPILEIKQTGKRSFKCRWKANVENFKMPLKIKTNAKIAKWTMQGFSTTWQTVRGSSIIVDTDNFYIKVNYIED
jgi:aminopeptidase N